MRPLWIAAATRPDAGDVLDVFTIDAAIAAPDGHALTSARLSLPDGRIHPSAPAWRAVADGGVRAGSILRRVTLAWARQAPTMLRVAPSHAVDWHLDPLDRVEALLPMLSWRVGGLVIVNERAVWLATGFATTDAAPLMMPRAWGTRRVASARPAIIATIDAASGATAFVSDPAAGPLGHAWGRIAGPMVAPPAAMDSALRAALDYPTEWLEAQLGILEGGAWQIGRRPGRRVADGPPEPPVWGWDGSGAFRRTAFEDPARRLITAVVTARRRGGVPELEVARVEATAIENGRELERRWSRGVTLSRLRDSVRAAGDSLVAGALHWHVGPDGLAAWTSYTSEGRRGEPTLLWIATAHDATMGGGRTALSAWSSLATTDADGSAIPSVDPDASERLGAIQGWVRRADSALARGDLTAFGRAWEALRGLLDELEAP